MCVYHLLIFPSVRLGSAHSLRRMLADFVLECEFHGVYSITFFLKNVVMFPGKTCKDTVEFKNHHNATIMD